MQIDKLRIADINPAADKRRVLTQQDKLDIYKAHHESGVAIRALARQYRVSRRLIQFTCYPERHEHNLQLRAMRGGSHAYYNRTRNTETMRKHRAYKRELLEKEA